MDESLVNVGVVVIGRNEAAHLRECLAAVPGGVVHRVYVDSASTDGSPSVARDTGVDVVELDPSQPMSAARARNAGVERLIEIAAVVQFLQFVDGDCILDPNWLAAALRAMSEDAKLGAVWGRLRERRPEASVYNRICDLEWRHPPAGEVQHFGGIVLLRADAFRAAGGYDPAVVASEDHELSARIRAAGWRIRRLDAPMATHDARLSRFAEWWRRGVRAGVGYAQVWGRHRGRARREAVGIRRAVFWGGLVPIASIACAPLTAGWSLAALAVYPLRVATIAANFSRKGASLRDGTLWGFHCVGTAFPCLCGVMTHAARRGTGRESRLVEYRDVSKAVPARGGIGTPQ